MNFKLSFKRPIRSLFVSQVLSLIETVMFREWDETLVFLCLNN